MNVLIISSFNIEKHYDLYGRRFIQGMSKLGIRTDITVDSCIEDMPNDARNMNVKVLEIDDPELNQFYKDYPKGKVKSYRNDGVRFAPKAFTIGRYLQQMYFYYDYIVWLDADTVINKSWDEEFFEEAFPKHEMVSALQRSKMHSETGFLAFNCNHIDLQAFANTYLEIWTSLELLQLPEQHDAYLFDVAIKRIHGDVRNLNAKNNHVHPFNYSILGKYMDHLKGKRKNAGESPEKYKGK